jgi:hypothetical protein
LFMTQSKTTPFTTTSQWSLTKFSKHDS